MKCILVSYAIYKVWEVFRLTNPNTTQKLIQLEDIILETASVAMIRQDMAEISKQNNLIFEESFDDLDFLA